MKRVTIIKSHFKPVGADLYEPPDCTEIHLSDGVGMILSEIVGISNKEDQTCSPHVVLAGIDRSMEPYFSRMENVGLHRKDFFDMVLTLRKMGLYAKNIGGFVKFQYLPNHHEM